MDSITVLTSIDGKRACKLWHADGSKPSGYGNAFKFKTTAHPVDSIRDLSLLLTALESQHNSMVIRGKQRGDDDAVVLRRSDTFDDQPHHWMLVDIDKAPDVSIDEFLTRVLPDFAGCSYHWQMSNSAGHASKPGLNAHVWFWLAEARTSEELKAWAPEGVDDALFNAVQPHYTAAPMFEPGAVDPVAVRSGFVEGLFGDEVSTKIATRTRAALVITGTDDDAENDRALLAMGSARLGWTGEFARELLARCDASCDHDHWARTFAAIHYEFEGGEEGLELLDEWSKTGKGYPGRREIETKYNSFGRERRDGRYVEGSWLLRWANECAVVARYAVVDDWKGLVAGATSEFELREKLCPKIAVDDRLGDMEREALAGVLLAAFKGLGTKYPIAACRKLVTPSMRTVENKSVPTHAFYASGLLADLKEKHGGIEPVGVEGSLFSPHTDGIWRGRDVAALAVDVADLYDGKERCERRSDYQAIATHAYDIAASGADGFFDDAPVGLPHGGVFYRLQADGSISSEPLRPEHRQRYAAPVAPQKGAMPLFDAFLGQTFAHEDRTETVEQIAMLQELLGAVALGLMAPHEKVVLITGPGRSGKGTILKITESLVPDEFRSAVSPFKWDQDYFVAGMAGKRLRQC